MIVAIVHHIFVVFIVQVQSTPSGLGAGEEGQLSPGSVPALLGLDLFRGKLSSTAVGLDGP